MFGFISLIVPVGATVDSLDAHGTPLLNQLAYMFCFVLMWEPRNRLRASIGFFLQASESMWGLGIEPDDPHRFGQNLQVRR